MPNGNSHIEIKPYLLKLERFFLDYFLFDNKIRSFFGWSFIFWVLVLLFNPYYFADLQLVYTDHMRHEYVSWAFLQVGFKVFTVPLGEIAPGVVARNPHPTWEMVPSLYPLGMILYFLPFGILSNLGVLPDVIVHKIMVLSFLFAAYLCVHHLTFDLHEDTGLFTRIIAPTVFYFSTVFWALNGFYDVIPLLFVVLSIRRFKDGDFFKGVIFSTVAFFMHYRALMYSPLLLKGLLSLWMKKDDYSRVLVNRALTAVSSLALVLTIYTLSISYRSLLSRPIPYGVGGWATSPVYLLNLGDVPLFMLFMILSIVAGSYLVGQGEFLSATIIFLIWVYLSLVFNWRIWHCLFFLPLAIMPVDESVREGVLLWLLFTMYYFNCLIDPLYVISLLVRMFSG